MKTKLVAVLMAVGLGVTGVAMTAQAAGASTANVTSDKCKHETLQYEEWFSSATYWDPREHISTYKRQYVCTNPNCFYTIQLSDDIRYEWHDYEQTYFHDGKVMSTCLGCHDSYYW